MVSGGQINNKGSAMRPHSVAYDLDHSGHEPSGIVKCKYTCKSSNPFSCVPLLFLI